MLRRMLMSFLLLTVMILTPSLALADSEDAQTEPQPLQQQIDRSGQEGGSRADDQAHAGDILGLLTDLNSIFMSLSAPAPMNTCVHTCQHGGDCIYECWCDARDCKEDCRCYYDSESNEYSVCMSNCIQVQASCRAACLC